MEHMKTKVISNEVSNAKYFYEMFIKQIFLKTLLHLVFNQYLIFYTNY